MKKNSILEVAKYEFMSSRKTHYREDYKFILITELLIQLAFLDCAVSIHVIGKNPHIKSLYINVLTY